eukprot:CCRYP_009003-RA/>CCRYP_009003-RA protein AED:0.46 eAED:0.40 QI:0/0/0/1/0/0/2/0/120
MSSLLLLCYFLVVWVHANGVSNQSKDFIMQKAVEGSTDTILDFIADTEEKQKNIVDYFVKKEGSTSRLWSPAAHVPKPSGGINHKEYSKTLECINVYLDVSHCCMLKKSPNEDKITGGPV